MCLAEGAGSRVRTRARLRQGLREGASSAEGCGEREGFGESLGVGERRRECLGDRLRFGERASATRIRKGF